MKLTLALLILPSLALAQESFDVVIYGGTSGGITAAIQADRMGKSAVIIEPSKWLGGLSTGGLGATDIGNDRAIGGIAREFYAAVLAHYQTPGKWRHEKPEDYVKRERLMKTDVQFGLEPHVATKTFDDMLAKTKVKVLLNERLDLKDGVKKDGAKITLIRMESGKTFAGTMYIDATYEGDLMARAGVTYFVGREANSKYGETLNGVQVKNSTKHQFGNPVDPYVKKGDASSGLLPFVHAGPPGKDGDADKRVQAYNFRLCLTDVTENQIPFPKPQGYDEKQYELLLRYFEAGYSGVPWGPRGLPNRKMDMNNNNGFSSDFIGENYSYPDADHATRAQIVRKHEDYQKGLMWTLGNHPRVPEKIRAQVSRWGLAKDEFLDNGHWPHQLYIREARRMIGEYVVTENDVWGKRKAEDPIALGAYGMDSHNVQRYVDEKGLARNEGDVQVHGFSPYGISYRALVPKADQCTNLLVPICLSATHISYGSIRMEPVFMITGQSAATAACIAIDDSVDVQKVDYKKLRARLDADKQVSEWTGPKGAGAPGKVIRSADLKPIALDDTQAKLTGEWSRGSLNAGVDGAYLHDADAGKGTKSARFEFKVPADGTYEVRLAHTPHANRSAGVPVTVESADGKKTVKVDQKKPGPIDELFVSLGTYRFTAGQSGVVIVSNEGTTGHVIIDGLWVVAK